MGWVAVVGDRAEGLEPQDTIGTAIDHAASALGVEVPDVRWMATDGIDLAALAEASGVWVAPGGPYRSLDGGLTAIRHAREAGMPLLGTCAGFQHGVIEFARNVLGHAGAAHAEYGDVGGELFIDELSCSLVGQTMAVEVLDGDLQREYGSAAATERYYCRFGLNPAWRQEIDEGGLTIAGVDADDEVRILRLAGHPFYVLTLFVPQTSSTPDRPHPLVRAFVAAVAAGDGD